MAVSDVTSFSRLDTAQDPLAVVAFTVLKLIVHTVAGVPLLVTSTLPVGVPEAPETLTVNVTDVFTVAVLGGLVHVVVEELGPSAWGVGLTRLDTTVMPDGATEAAVAVPFAVARLACPV